MLVFAKRIDDIQGNELFDDLMANCQAAQPQVTNLLSNQVRLFLPRGPAGRLCVGFLHYFCMYLINHS